jgi:gluconolactonase
VDIAARFYFSVEVSAVRRILALSLFVAFALGIVMPTSILAETPKTLGKIERLDPAFDKLVPADAQIEVLAGGFTWSEGICWIKDKGYLVVSDIPPNKIMKWDPKSGLSLFMERVGYTGKEPFTGEEPGTNGLMLDPQGRIVACCHGDRVVKRIEKDGKLTILADKYEGKRFNSPNDLVYKSNGDLYFTDPPYGLPKRENDPTRELDWFGVYRLGKDGKVTLLTKEMTRPNGIGFSPDQKTLYVAQSDPAAAIVKAFPVNADGTLGKSRLLYDATPAVERKEPGLPDGMAVDKQGHIWATGPGGVYCLTPDGKLLGRLNTGERTANCKFGDDGKTLFICADDYICRVRTNVTGTNY